MVAQLLHRRVGRDRRAIGSVGRHRLEGVGDEDDPRLERDLGAGEPAGVTAAVPVLVVMEDPGVDWGHVVRVEQVEADLRVLVDELLLGRVERARLVQHGVGDSDLAEVV